MNKENSLDKNKLMDSIIKIVLIIIIILLLIHNCELIKRQKKSKTPTGNVDIIEIKCDKEDKCINPIKEDDTEDDKKNSNNGGSTVPVNGKDDDELPSDFEGELIVEDEEIKWNDEVTARIFTNSLYEIEDMIAPESTNTYQFVVRNGTNYKLKYNIHFIESNPYGINMKYKLKKNDAYIIDHYVSASELIISDSFLEAGNNDTYYLEWKWVSSNNDTQIGKTPDANYGLKLEVEAESTNG